MFENHYPTIKNIIDEYQLIECAISTNREIFTYYPKLFVMAIVSLFEKEIKEKCNNIITNPLNPLSTLPRLRNLVNSRPKDILMKIYGKFIANETAGIINLSASDFYDLYGGISFENCTRSYFNLLKCTEISDYQVVVKNLYNLIGVDKKYDDAYSENDDIYNRLQNNDFTNAETAFLKLKLRRNKVAHDFLCGISDTFEDIRNLYYDAVLYVVALKKDLSDLSSI